MIRSSLWELLLFQLYLKSFQPVIELYEIGYSLRQVHELTVPLHFILVAQQLFELLTLYELSKPFSAVIEYTAELFRNSR